MWEGPVERLSVDGAGGVVLAVRDADAGVAVMRAFDAVTLAAAGPEIPVAGFACLGRLADDDAPVAFDVGPVYGPERLRIWDPQTGEPIAEYPVDLGLTEVMAVGAGRVGGRPAVFVHGMPGPREAGWRAVHPHTGRTLLRDPEPHYAYFLWEARIAVVGDLLVCTAQETQLDEHGDLQYAVARVYDLAKGAYVGAVNVDVPDGFAVGPVGGRPVLATWGNVHALPSLEVIHRVPGTSGCLAVGEADGMPVVVSALGGPGPREPDPALGVWFPDESAQAEATRQEPTQAAPTPAGSAPAKPTQHPASTPVVLPAPWHTPVNDLALTPAGGVLVAADDGLFHLPGVASAQAPSPTSR
ncbi:MAG: hypothetical protein HOV68_21420 [Streptomycetaceae bacterium]|nr:hypothetical protein [Streptomycetaceae bacterium]